LIILSYQPGIDWMTLNSELEKYDLFLPVDPGPGASIGSL
jgi:D-lactate dehydrogenase (cytochrome)